MEETLDRLISTAFTRGTSSTANGGITSTGTTIVMEQFIASPMFAGPRTGYYFGTSDKGTGYHLDITGGAAAEAPEQKRARFDNNDKQIVHNGVEIRSGEEGKKKTIRFGSNTTYFIPSRSSKKVQKPTKVGEEPLAEEEAALKPSTIPAEGIGCVSGYHSNSNISPVREGAGGRGGTSLVNSSSSSDRCLVRSEVDGMVICAKKDQNNPNSIKFCFSNINAAGVSKDDLINLFLDWVSMRNSNPRDQGNQVQAHTAGRAATVGLGQGDPLSSSDSRTGSDGVGGGEHRSDDLSEYSEQPDISISTHLASNSHSPTHETNPSSQSPGLFG